MYAIRSLTWPDPRDYVGLATRGYAIRMILLNVTNKQYGHSSGQQTSCYFDQRRSVISIDYSASIYPLRLITQKGYSLLGQWYRHAETKRTPSISYPRTNKIELGQTNLYSAQSSIILARALMLKVTYFVHVILAVFCV